MFNVSDSEHYFTFSKIGKIYVMQKMNKGMSILNKKMKILMIVNIIFFALIAFHHIVIYYFGDDWVLYVLLLSALVFSSIFLEDTVRQRILKLRTIAFIEFGLRIFAISVHLVSIFYGLYFYLLIGVIGTVFILTLVFQWWLLKKINKLKYVELEEFNSGDLNDFIDKLFDRGTTFSSEEENDRIKKLKGVLLASGRSNIILIVLFINLRKLHN
ncbi:hypothetical protein [Anaerobranca gottschalkii]|uniref:Uncharacterized protein n=1 Tax=Anaerobranca gottschalkii DSM 13577 TaxID=1120990 RepID=A0A1I0D0H6_9FIRM|nr:hypothetical protein [Anaerobranca gottschalkii]SET24909.1 hypothetical protein SAMN03080614_11071 [Anaerobranca gottschalkii DSM 13577]